MLKSVYEVNGKIVATSTSPIKVANAVNGKNYVVKCLQLCNFSGHQIVITFDFYTRAEAVDFINLFRKY